MNQTEKQFENRGVSRLCSCYESDLIGAMKINAKGIIQSVNAYLAAMLECPVTDLIHTPLKAFIDPDEQEAMQHWWHELWQTNLPRTVETRLYSQAKGAPIPTLISGRVLPDRKHLFLILQDITPIKAKT